MENNVIYQQGHETIVFGGHVWERVDMDHTCENCRNWANDNEVNGWATCALLVHTNAGWRLVPRVEADPGSASIVKTYKTFGCRYWEGIE
jgi:hypothetical protein